MSDSKGMAGTAWRGSAGQGSARRGLARQGRRGMARHGPAWRGVAWLGNDRWWRVTTGVPVTTPKHPLKRKTPPGDDGVPRGP